jgi:hypothetical protein
VFAFQKFMLSKNRFSTSEALKAGGSFSQNQTTAVAACKRRPSYFLCATGVQVFGGPILDEAGKNIAQTVALELVSQIPDLKLPPIRQELDRAPTSNETIPRAAKKVRTKPAIRPVPTSTNPWWLLTFPPAAR